jgi:2-(1,2-epoxy-1,2-dihydrophenyl)acetyl-CoA isomerase
VAAEPARSEPGLDATRSGAVSILRFTRPEALNTLTVEVLEALADELRRAARDPATRAVVLTGTGRAFCAGGDMRVLQAAAEDPDLVSRLSALAHEVSRGLEQLDKPTICAVNGVAAGAGVDLSLACDLRVASSSAWFKLTFTSIGLIPDTGATWRLPRIVGLPKAKELVFFGRPVEAEEALAIGLVNRVLEPERLIDEATEWARTLAEERGPLALGASKALLDQALATDLATGLKKEQLAARWLTATSDFKEGVSAFVEKRAPRFTGR